MRVGRRTTALPLVSLLAGAAAVAALASAASDVRAADAPPVARLRAAFPGAKLFVPTGDTRAAWAGHLLAGPYAGATVRPELAAAPFLAEHGAAFGVGPATTLALEAVWPIGPGSAVHLVQRIGGVPVIGGEIVLTVDADGRVRSASGRVIDGAGIDTVPSIAADEATATALALEPPGATTTGAPLLAILGGGGSSAALVWRVRTIAGPAHATVTGVDAHSGEVVWREDVLRDARGRFYDPNPAVNPATVDDVLPALDAPGDVLTGTYANVMNCAAPSSMSCTTERNAQPDAAGDFLYDPPVPPGAVYDDPFAEVHAYEHVSRFGDHWATALGYPMWSYLQPLDVIVNFSSGMMGTETDPESYNNAFFNPNTNQILFGQGNTYDFVYDADVVYHEYTHGIVGDRLASVTFDSLGMDLTGLALNEGTADTFSVLYTGDSHMAEWIGGPAGLRDLDNDNVCPGNLVGESHEDGKPWGGANWAARTFLESTLGPGAGAAAMEVLLTRALLAIAPTGSYAGFSNEVVNQAEMDPAYAALVPDLEALYGARGLLDCERIVPLDDGLVHFSITLGRAQLFISLPFVPPALQFRIDVPENKGLRIQLGAFGTAMVGAYVRRDAPVAFAGFGSTLTVTDSDWQFMDQSIFEVDRESVPTVEAGTYYIAITNEDAYPLYMGVLASLFDVDPLVTSDAGASSDAGTSDAGDGPAATGGGCGCRIAAPHGGGDLGLAWAGVVALGLVWRARRRARG